jgi:hypothetical protein
MLLCHAAVQRHGPRRSVSDSGDSSVTPESPEKLALDLRIQGLVTAVTLLAPTARPPPRRGASASTLPCCMGRVERPDRSVSDSGDSSVTPESPEKLAFDLREQGLVTAVTLLHRRPGRRQPEVLEPSRRQWPPSGRYASRSARAAGDGTGHAGRSLSKSAYIDWSTQNSLPQGSPITQKSYPRAVW